MIPKFLCKASPRKPRHIDEILSTLRDNVKDLEQFIVNSIERAEVVDDKISRLESERRVLDQDMDKAQEMIDTIRDLITD